MLIRDVFAAMAEPTRRALLLRLNGGPLSLPALLYGFAATKQNVERQLNFLIACGLVTTSKKNATLLYAMVPDKFNEAEQWLLTVKNHKFAITDEALKILQAKQLADIAKTRQKHCTYLYAAAGETLFNIERKFNAPKNKLYQAFTNPVLMAQWLGFTQYALKVEEGRPAVNNSVVFHNKAGNKIVIAIDKEKCGPPLKLLQSVEFAGFINSRLIAEESILFRDLPGGQSLIIANIFF